MRKHRKTIGMTILDGNWIRERNIKKTLHDV
jgi:hypothetical protein